MPGHVCGQPYADQCRPVFFFDGLSVYGPKAAFSKRHRIIFAFILQRKTRKTRFASGFRGRRRSTVGNRFKSNTGADPGESWWLIILTSVHTRLLPPLTARASMQSSSHVGPFQHETRECWSECLQGPVFIDQSHTGQCIPMSSHFIRGIQTRLIPFPQVSELRREKGVPASEPLRNPEEKGVPASDAESSQEPSWLRWLGPHKVSHPAPHLHHVFQLPAGGAEAVQRGVLSQAVHKLPPG